MHSIYALSRSMTVAALMRRNSLLLPASAELLFLVMWKLLMRVGCLLLATFVYKSIPDKSLALFQSGGSQECFYTGQKVGSHTIAEIRDGHVMMSLPGRPLQKVNVPAKRYVSLLIDE